MKHAASRELFSYWEERRGNRPAPERAEIEPGAIRRVLGDAFILAIDGSKDHPLRLAGTRVCALFNREIRGESFLGLWDPASRRTMADLLSVLATEYGGTVAGVNTENSAGEPLNLELLLLPLGARRPLLARAIGILAPLQVPNWLGVSPIGALMLGSRRHVGSGIEKRLLPRFLAARVRPTLTVHAGGRS